MSFARVHAFHFPKQSFSRADRMDRWSGFCVRNVPRIWDNLVKAIVVAPCPPNLRADPAFKVHCHPRSRQIGFLLPLTMTTTLLWPRGCRLFLLSAMMSSACSDVFCLPQTHHFSRYSSHIMLIMKLPLTPSPFLSDPSPLGSFLYHSLSMSYRHLDHLLMTE